MAKAFDEQLSAGKKMFEEQRKETSRELEQSLLDTWGVSAENWGLTGSNMSRIKEAGARGYAQGIGGIDAAERMWGANVRRAEEARAATEKGNTWRTIGTIGGMALAAALTLPTGGLAAGLFPILAGSLGGFGGSVGGLAAGGDTSDLPATLTSSLNAAGSAYHINELLKLQQDLAGTGYTGAMASPGWNDSSDSGSGRRRSEGW